MIEQIRKEDIPDWEYGDVAIKTFSFGEKFEIANLKAKIIENKQTNKKDIELNESEINVKDVSLKGLASGLHFIRTKENAQFIIKPGSSLKDREDFAYKMEFGSGKYLLKKIQELNKEISKDEEKN